MNIDHEDFVRRVRRVADAVEKFGRACDAQNFEYTTSLCEDEGVVGLIFEREDEEGDGVDVEISDWLAEGSDNFDIHLNGDGSEDGADMDARLVEAIKYFCGDNEMNVGEEE